MWLGASVLALALIAALLAVRWRQSAAPRAAVGSGWLLVDSRMVNHHVLVRLGFASGVEPQWWILDSGSTHNLVDANYAARFDRRLKGSIRDVNQPGAAFSAQALEHGYVLQRDGRRGPAVDLGNAAVLDLRHLAQSVALPLAGIVGHPFLSQCVVSIDFPRQQVWLRDRRSAFSLPPPASHATPSVIAAPLGQHHLLLLPVAVNGQPAGPWSLDTGSNISIAAHELAQRAQLRPSDGGAVQAQLVNRAITVVPSAASIAIGGGAPRAATLFVPQQAQPLAHATVGLDGNLGTDLLQHCRITIDCSNERVILD